MKRIMFFLTAAAVEAGASSQTASLTAVKPEPNSEELTKLKAQEVEAGNKLAGLAVGSKDWNDALQGIFKVQKLIEAEKAAILKAEKDAQITLERNKRIALVVDFEAAVLADAKVQAGKGTAEDKQASTDALAVLRTNLQNELLAKYSTSTPAAGDKPAGTGKGATSAAIKAVFDEMRAANPNATQAEISKEAQARGFARGTSDSVILAYMKELGLK